MEDIKDCSIIKIKDSVDLFLNDDHYLMVYYMNTRQRKSFRINDSMVNLLQTIDGKKSVKEIVDIMLNEHEVEEEQTRSVIEMLYSHKILTPVMTEQSFLTAEEVDRYTRQINYFSEFSGSEIDGLKAQKKLFDSHIAVFGCGAVGGNIAVQLAMAGIGSFTLYDDDFVEVSDAARHIYYDENSIGEKKVNALKRELLSINSKINVETVDNYMHPDSDVNSIITDSDFIINTLDEPYIGYTSAKISRLCVKHNKPHYIAGGFDAHLASTGELIIPYITPCVECYASHFKVALKDWKPKKHPVIDRFRDIGGLASMSLFSSSFASIEIVKYLTGITDINQSFKIRGEFLFHDMSLKYLNLRKDPDCKVCGKGAPE